MNKLILSMPLVFLFSFTLHAEPIKRSLENMNGCYACHSVKLKVIGPSFIEISNRYKNQESARMQLVKKIKEGGSGNWGSVPMNAHPKISDTDLSLMVDWILSL
ncbi:MAG: cytochrome C [Methylophilaceae bacterium]|nr:cytochrome C [Methylophilaceae bacterium]